MKHFSQEEKEKQITESHKSRVEREFCLHNLENREEKENCFKNLTNREEKENFCLKILKIEKRKRNENTIPQLEREKYESFLLKIFSRSRLLSMTTLYSVQCQWQWGVLETTTGDSEAFQGNFLIEKMDFGHDGSTMKNDKLKFNFEKGSHWQLTELRNSIGFPRKTVYIYMWFPIYDQIYFFWLN